MTCDDWNAVSITDCQLSRKEIEQLVGMAVAEQLAADGPTSGAAEPAAAAGMALDAAAAAAAPAADAASPAAAQRSGSMEVAPQQPEARAAAAAEAASTVDAQPQPQAQQLELIECMGHVGDKEFHYFAPISSFLASLPMGPGGAPPSREREASATVDEPAAMQTDGDETAAPGAAGAASAAQPADGTVAQPAGEGAGTAAAAAAGEAGKVQPPWTLRAEHLMAAAEALRKLQAEAAAQPEKQALRDVAVDQYEKQLLSEVG